MKKRKEYENTKFVPSTLRAARDLIDYQVTDLESEKIFLVLWARTSENETWTFDSEEEFFAAYPNSMSVTYNYQNGKRGVVVDFDGKSTSVSVSASTIWEVEAIFNIFEETASSSQLPVKSASALKSVSDLKSFQSETAIPSVYVNRKLLEKIELYCVEELPKIAHIEAAKIKEKYSIAIIDSSGAERLKSINQYPHDIFPDTVPEIVIAVSSVFSDIWSSKWYLDFLVRFHRDKSFSKVHVNCTAENPRATVIGIRDGLMRRINEAKTLSYICHPPDWVDGLLFGLAGAGFYLALRGVPEYLKGSVADLVICFFALALVIYYAIAKRWNPYTAFDSKIQIRRSRWWNWLLYGFAGFIIFSTILSVVRKKFMGF